MVPEKSQRGVQLFDNEQEREEAQCETSSTQIVTPGMASLLLLLPPALVALAAWPSWGEFT
jgi:hypothetical protein